MAIDVGSLSARKSLSLIIFIISHRTRSISGAASVQRLIAEMATANRTWGEERIAAELLVKLGIRLSPRTVRRYMPPSATPRSGRGSQAWSTFIRNHARSLLACDFFVAVTATFGLVYVFVALALGTRRILHWNTTAHPTGEWTAQQFRMIVLGDQAHRFVIHDRDCIYSEDVDRTLTVLGLTVLRTPVRAPQAKNGMPPPKYQRLRIATEACPSGIGC
jgi:hypothetical protein